MKSIMAKTDASLNPDSSDRTELEGSPEVLHVALRDRCATPIAVIFTTMHLLSCLMTAGWFYIYVPRMKKIFDDFGTELSESVLLAIKLSDLFVNYWYIAVFFGIAGLVADFVATRWITKQLGLIAAITFGVCVTAILLSNVAYSYPLMQDAMRNIPVD